MKVDEGGTIVIAEELADRARTPPPASRREPRYAGRVCSGRFPRTRHSVFHCYLVAWARRVETSIGSCWAARQHSNETEVSHLQAARSSAQLGKGHATIPTRRGCGTASTWGTELPGSSTPPKADASLALSLISRTESALPASLTHPFPLRLNTLGCPALASLAIPHALRTSLLGYSCSEGAFSLTPCGYLCSPPHPPTRHTRPPSCPPRSAASSTPRLSATLPSCVWSGPARTVAPTSVERCVPAYSPPCMRPS
jgi:hypothetical protein